MADDKEILTKLVQEFLGVEITRLSPIPAHASTRRMYRVYAAGRSAIGVISPNPLETKAFVSFSETFSDCGINVPQVLGLAKSLDSYLVTDLGDVTLFDWLEKNRGEDFSDKATEVYQKALKDLLKIQFECGKFINFEDAYPFREFSVASMVLDLQYFAREFLSQTNITVPKLDDVFHDFAGSIPQPESSVFMYRDFQARNIMINEGELYYIDFQGGRIGPPLYDVASFLYQAKAKLPFSKKWELFDFYASEARKKGYEIYPESFPKILFLRIAQVLGTYGALGLKGGKDYFKQSIPPAIENLESCIKQAELPDQLLRICEEIVERFKKGTLFEEKMNKPLVVHISSFSYRNGKVPEDPSGNGGGFVFDCRAIPNPGRRLEFKNLTGTGSEVREFLDGKADVEEFFESVRRMVEMTAANYQARGFSSLMVSFGCTGGQHRSVYFSERLSKYLEDKGYKAEVNHTQLPYLGLS